MISKAKKVSDYKQLTKELPTLRYVDPEHVYINLTTARCKEYELSVSKGDRVKLGEIIGERSGGFFKQPIYSTVSGYVQEKTTMIDSTGIEVECITIRNDFKDEYCSSIVDRPDSVIQKMTQQDFVDIVRDKALVGLGGSGFPSYVKLATDKDIHTVVINAVECEPYLSSDYRLIKDQPEDIFRGLEYIMQAVNAERGVIAIKKTKKELIEVLERELTRFKDKDIRIAKLKDYYPQGWENATFESAVGVKVPVGVLPMEYGILGFNVSTTASIYEAVKHNKPITKRHLTVNGDAVNFPQDILVRVGTSVQDLIKLSDGYTEDADEIEIVIGGPMMGISVPTDNVVVTPTTTSVLVLKSTDYKEEPCVRCGSCIYSCPVDIEPVSIMNAVKRGDVEAAENLDAMKCIECGLCAYVCTSKIHVTDYVREAKNLIKESK
ncbi:MAG: RnfABCDGE type electron transport complex subunit C [Candidatus Izemoplasmataceae bacterium]